MNHKDVRRQNIRVDGGTGARANACLQYRFNGRDDLTARQMIVAHYRAFTGRCVHVVVRFVQCRQFRLDCLLDELTGTTLDQIVQAAQRCRCTVVRLSRQLTY